MTNKILLLTFMVWSVFQIGFSQSLIPKDIQKRQAIPAAVHPAAYLQVNPNLPTNQTILPTSSRDVEEVVIGTTFFDLQAGGSMNRRIYTNGDEVSASWHYGLDAVGFPDRGTGFNHYDGSDWGPSPTNRVEADIRGGYPSFTVLEDGTQVVVSHLFIDPVWHIGVYRKAPGSDVWTQSMIPSTVSTGGMVWAKVATGGADGQSLHVVAITLDEAFGGTPYRGMAQHLLYFRSQDGGDSWDISDMVVPGCDSTFYNSIDSEAYNIDAQGETVVFGVFPGWGDAALFKSQDNGNTWAKTIVFDFPLDKYDGMGYTADDIPMDVNAPDPLAIFTTDGSASILVDDNEEVHVVYGDMYVSGDDVGGLFFFPGTDGLSYWNESMGTGEAINIAFVEDLNDTDSIEVVGIASYFLSLTSMPSMGIDADGTYYVAYSAFNELYSMDQDGQNYRQPFIVASQDGGVTWTEPSPVLNEETTDPDFIEFIEGVYPSIPRRIGEDIQLIYQQDFQPGMHVIGDQDVATENFIMYLELTKESLGISSASELQVDIESIYVFPNPTSTTFKIDYTLNELGRVEISLVDLFGQTIVELPNKTQSAGNYQEKIDVHDIAAGVYFVKIQIGHRTWTEKIVVN